MANQTETAVMTVLCAEPEGDFYREVYLMKLSVAALKALWEQLSQFETLFNDFSHNDPEAFINTFVHIDDAGDVHPRGLIWEVDDVGIIYLDEIAPGNCANLHITFWDRRFRGRESLVRHMLSYMMEKFDLHRISVLIPDNSRPANRYIPRVGFRREGVLREAFLYKGKWIDVNSYGILRSEVENG